MSILTITWSMIGGACLMLCFLHVLLWWKDRRQRYYLLSALMALASGIGALIELGLMRSNTVAVHQSLLQTQNTVVGVMLVSMVWFVRGYLRTGRRWLVLVITGLWTASVAIDLLSPSGIIYKNLQELTTRTTFWGETFVVARGDTSALKLLPDLTSLLIAVFAIDATVRSWRRGRRQAAVVVGGSITIFILAAGIHTPLVDAGLVATPFMISVAFLAIVIALSYQLVDDASRTLRYGREIRASEQRWRRLQDQVQLAVLDIDPAGLVRYVNPFYEQLTGRTATEVVGRPVTSLMIESEAAALAERFDAAAAASPRPHSRWTLVTAGGGTRVCDWSSVRQVTPDGGFDGVLSIGADVTEELAARRDLERTRSRLERVVRAGMLGELVSALSHELNQPLAAILANAQAARRYLAREQPRLDEVHAILDRIVADEKRAATVIERLRALLMRGETARERLELAPLIAEVVALVQPELDQQRIVLEVDLDPDLPPVSAGRVEFQQVLLNLILNALRAFESAELKQRRIRVRAAGEPGDQVAVTVTDTGPGIAADQVDRLFEPFQGDREGHLGMGLAICRRIVEAYGGTIGARNGDVGARFVFTLPVATEEVASHAR